MNVGTLNIKSAEVNGAKAKSLRTGLEMLTDSKRAGQGKLPYLALDSFIWGFSATILRPLTSARNYATLSRPKRQYGGIENACNAAKATAIKRQSAENENQRIESHARRKKRQPIPKRFSAHIVNRQQNRKINSNILSIKEQI